MPKEVYYKYALLYYKMTNQYRLTVPTKATLFLDITSGGVGLTVWRGESLLFQRNMHSGSCALWNPLTVTNVLLRRFLWQLLNICIA